jgi:hypothetical protein
VKLELFSSKRGSLEPNLVAIQATDLTMLPTVLVCPLLAGEPVSGVRTFAEIDGRRYTVLCDLARPINRRLLVRVGTVDEITSRRIMAAFSLLLAQ